MLVGTAGTGKTSIIKEYLRRCDNDDEKPSWSRKVRCRRNVVLTTMLYCVDFVSDRSLLVIKHFCVRDCL